jgi:hypothetical protein
MSPPGRSHRSYRDCGVSQLRPIASGSLASSLSVLLAPEQSKVMLVELAMMNDAVRSDPVVMRASAVINQATLT